MVGVVVVVVGVVAVGGGVTGGSTKTTSTRREYHITRGSNRGVGEGVGGGGVDGMGGPPHGAVSIFLLVQQTTNGDEAQTHL